MSTFPQWMAAVAQAFGQWIESGRGYHKWPTRGPGGDRTYAVWRVPNASGGRPIGNGPQVCLAATQALPSAPALRFRDGGQDHKRATCRLCGYITLLVRVPPNASRRATKSVVAHK